MFGVSKIAFLGIAIASVAFVGAVSADPAEERTNQMGQSLWRRLSPQEYQDMETREYNEKMFESSLSEFALAEFRKFSPEQKKRAMELADNSQYSPENAVFKVSTRL